MIEEKRIQGHIDEISQFSSTDTGTTRFSFTKEEMAARNYIKNQMKEIGLMVSEDGAGTIIGRIEGERPDLPVIMLGSHFDSVGHGGNYDGVAGVAAAMEVARELIRQKIKNKYPIEIVAMTEEEGIRFGVGLFGSKAMAGFDKKDALYQRSDKNGITMAEAMRTCGFDPEQFETAKRKQGSVKAFLELHIDQGSQLEKNKTDIGIVKVIAGNKHLNVRITGNADHAGGTPMNMRKDACVAAAEIILGVNSFVSGLGNGDVATVGRLDIYPNVRNVIPQTASFMIDNRSIDSEQLDVTADKLKEIVINGAKKHGCEASVQQLKKVSPICMDDDIRNIIKEKAKLLGYSQMDINSGAGHDAMIMGTFAPAAMIFIPCRNGKSHCPEEYASCEDMRKGAEVLYETVKQLALGE